MVVALLRHRRGRAEVVVGRHQCIITSHEHGRKRIVGIERGAEEHLRLHGQGGRERATEVGKTTQTIR